MRKSDWFSKAASVVVLSIFLLPAACPTFALQKPVTAPNAASTAAPTDDELIATREQIVAMLHVSPTLTQVLEIDPSLLADQDYVARANPPLAQFLTQHPEVTRNPDFYLFANLNPRGGRSVPSLHRRVDGNEPRNDEAWQRQNMMITIQQILVFVGIVGSLLWLIRLFLQSRRWTRVFRLQSEIHNKLIDRFANNQEILHYMETEPGKLFLEAAPIPIEPERDQRLPGGLARVLGPLQIGIVLTLLGIGLLILQRSLPDISDPLLVFGMVAMMPGIGFIISALITWRMSVRLGLMPNGPQPSTDPTEPIARQ